MQICQVEQGESQVIINELMDKAEKLISTKNQTTKKLDNKRIYLNSGLLIDTEQMFNVNSYSSREISTR